MSIDMNLLSVNADALSTNQNDELPGWNVPSRMAFHIVFDGRLDINGRLSPVIRRPYRDTSRPYNQRRDFMAHESRQILDDRMPDGVEYGIVTFEGGSKAAREETRRVVEHLSRGWTNNGKRFRCVYAHVADSGLMLFVDAKSSIHSPDNLGIYISSDPKAAKRVRRFFSAHSLMLKGRVIDRAKSPLGMQYAVQMEDERLLSVLDFDMKQLDERQRALKEGSCICRIPGFDGTTATAFAEHKADFVTAKAASNSDRMVDWLQMRKGDKATFLELVTNAMEALKTPIFPLCFASRIPKDRQEAGDYILVETKLCRALATLRLRRDQLIEDNRQLEHLVKRPLATALLDRYPVDDAILRISAELTYWWREQFDSARRQSGGAIRPETFQRAAYGYSSLMEVELPDGKIKLEEIHQPGLIDLYTNQFSVSGTVFSVSGSPWSVETRRKIGIHLANTRYTDDREPRLDNEGFIAGVITALILAMIFNHQCNKAVQFTGAATASV